MSNRLAVRHFFCCTFCIHVNPLMIRGSFGKLVDAMLVNNNPVRQADLLTHKRLRIFDRLYDAQFNIPL